MENTINEDKEQILNFAQMFLKNGDFEEALAQCNKILAAAPDDMDALETLGDIHSKKNDNQSAYETYNQAASFFLNNGQIDKTIPLYKKIAELDPAKLPDATQAQIKYAQGYIKIADALKEENLESAIELFGKILKFRPDDPVVRTQLMVLDSKINDLPATIQTYQKLGDVFFKNNMFEKAREMFTKVTTIDPENPAVRLHLAQVYLKQGSQSEAKKEYLNLAEDAYAKGNFELALDAAKKAIELKSVEAHYISGLIYFKQEKFEEAVTEFEVLLRLKTNHLGALIHLGKSLDMLGRLEKAKATFAKALETDNENTEVQEAWIDFCVRTKNIDAAIPNMTAILKKAVGGNNAELVAKYAKLMLKLEPDNVATHAKLIESLETLGDNHGAAEALYRVALLLERKKDFDKAVECLEKALLLSPTNASMLEKALVRMDKSESKSKYGVAIEDDNPIILKNSDFWSDSSVSNPAEFMIDAGPAASLEDPLVLASSCVLLGYLKAAIEIYQQMLETNPGAEDIRKKLADVSAAYLKKLTGPK